MISLFYLHIAGVFVSIVLRFLLLQSIAMKTSTMFRFMRALKTSARRFHIEFDYSKGELSSPVTGEAIRFVPIVPPVQLLAPKFLIQVGIFGWVMVPSLAKDIWEVVAHPRDLHLWSEDVAANIMTRTQILKDCNSSYVRSQLLEVCKTHEISPENNYAIEKMINTHFDRVISYHVNTLELPRGVQ